MSVLMLILPALCSLATSGGDSPPLSIDDVTKGLAAREQVVRTYGFRAVYRAVVRSDYSGKMISYTTACDIKVDRSLGRFSISKTGQVPSGPTPYTNNQESLTDQTELVTFDGETTRSLTTIAVRDKTGEDTGRVIQTARIVPGSHPFWLGNPEDILAVSPGKKLEDRFRRGTWRLNPAEGGTIAVQGDFGVPPNSTGGAERRFRFWVSPEKGMALLHKEFSLKFPGKSDWIAYASMWFEDLSQTNEGVWVPQTFRQETIDARPDANPVLQSSKVAKLSNWAINQKYPDAMFKLQFPPGVLVNDVGRGTTYKTSAITDKKVAEDASKASELRGTYLAALASSAESPRPSRWPWVLAATLFCALLLLFGGWAINRAFYTTKRLET